MPKYTEDSTLNVAIDRRMQQAGIPRGTPLPEAILTQAQEDVETGKIRVSASQGTGQIVKGPTGEYIRVSCARSGDIKAPGGNRCVEAKRQMRATAIVSRRRMLATELEDKGYKPNGGQGVDKLPAGLGNLFTSSDYQRYRQTVREFASAWLYGVSGAQITDSEWENANQTFFPQPNETQSRGGPEARAPRRPGEAVGTTDGWHLVAPAPRPRPRARAARAAQGPAISDTADFLKWRQGAGKSGNPTQADVEAYFQAKGLKGDSRWPSGPKSRSLRVSVGKPTSKGRS